MESNYLMQSVVYLAAAVIAVPIFSRLRLGSVLGYLAAGILVGPAVLDLVGDTEAIMHFAELGVVMMLFLVGLELRPRMLWSMKAPVFGLGGLQVLLTAVIVGAFAVWLGQPWPAAVAIGCALALSSTAIVLQSLSERGQRRSAAGASAFGVLLFQDIAVIPILALLPLLGGDTGHTTYGSVVAGLPPGLRIPLVLTVIGLVLFGSRYLLRPVFRAVAATGLRELFTATALLVVVGISVLMSAIELSPALGTFLGGVVLAESEYRHELESDLEPFKGLLLGLFFITVGAGIDFLLLASAPLRVLGLVALLMAGKAAVLYALTSIWRMPRPDRWTVSLALGQAGEFGFVLLAAVVSQHLVSEPTARLVTLIVALSMALTPIAFWINDRFVQPRFSGAAGAREADDPSAGHGKPVVIAGFGRYGQLAGRLLKANGFESSILDLDPDSIATLREHGLEVYYGDAARADLLATAGCSAARVLVVSIDDPQRSAAVVELARKHFGQLRIIGRARDPRHALALREAGADHAVCEAEGGGIALGEAALRALGFGAWRAARAARKFRHHQIETNRQLMAVQEDATASLSVHRQRVRDLHALLDLEDEEGMIEVDRAWRTATVGDRPDEAG